jgi:DNA-binding transcriptional ArsR family regulator
MGLRHVFGEKPIPKVLDFLLVHRNWDYPLSAIEEATGLSYRTLQMVMPSLVKSHMAIETREVGKAKMYQINAESRLVAKLDELAIEADLAAAEKEAKIPIKAVVKRAK